MTYTDTSVADIMTTNVLVAHKGLSFTEICNLFFELRFHHLPVLDENEALMGIISSNDLLNVLSKQMLLKKDLNANDLDEHIGLNELMTKNPVSIHSGATIEEAARLLRQHQIHSLPVLEEGKVVGIVTSTDLVKCFTEKF